VIESRVLFDREAAIWGGVGVIWPLKVAIATFMIVPGAFLTWAALRGFSVSAQMTKSAVHRRSPVQQRVIWVYCVVAPFLILAGVLVGFVIAPHQDQAGYAFGLGVAAGGADVLLAMPILGGR
jgi:hypothetical protein